MANDVVKIKSITLDNGTVINECYFAGTPIDFVQEITTHEDEDHVIVVSTTDEDYIAECLFVEEPVDGVALVVIPVDSIEDFELYGVPTLDELEEMAEEYTATPEEHISFLEQEVETLNDEICGLLDEHDELVEEVEGLQEKVAKLEAENTKLKKSLKLVHCSFKEMI